MSDPFALSRFVQAQAGGTFEQALAELRAGAKRTHWMWFIFPQWQGLGRSETARFYAIRSRGEAQAYLTHPTLGPRLLTCVEAIVDGPEPDAVRLFGSVDALKLHSSLTLFGAMADDAGSFNAALERFFGGRRDPATLTLIEDAA